LNALDYHVHGLRKPKRLPRAPVMRLPSLVWRDYASQITLQIIDKWRSVAQRLIIDRLPAIERQVNEERPGGIKKDSWPDELSNNFEQLREEYDKIAQQSEDIAAGVFRSVDMVSHRQWYEAAQKVLGVDLFTFEPWLPAESQAFVEANVDLVQKIQYDLQSELSRVVYGGFRSGSRWETIAGQIMRDTELGTGVFHKIETRAELIARDQTLKLYADIGEKRQTGAGLKLYIWRTLLDERVVGNPNGKYPNPTEKHGDHYEMEGKVCRWDNSNVYADSVEDAIVDKWKERTAEMPKDTPGKDINCRCYASPVFETLFQ
jgi:uncharacterized protein with gpF-like domain